MDKIYGSSFRANLKECMDKAERQPLLIERRNAPDLVLMSKEEYERLISQRNDDRMLTLEIEQKVDAALNRRLIEFERLMRQEKEVF